MGKVALPPKVLVLSDRPAADYLWLSALKQQLVEATFELDPQCAIKSGAVDAADLILIDCESPTPAVIAWIKDLRCDTHVPILLVAHAADESLLLAAYHAGADDVLVQPTSADLILVKTRIWLERAGALPSGTQEALQAGGLQFFLARRILVLENGARVSLTRLEARLLAVLMRSPGRALEVNVLMQAVWGVCGTDSPNALKNVVYRLRRKIEVDPAKPHRLLSASPSGYLFC